jgi:hypothetical protein
MYKVESAHEASIVILNMRDMFSDMKWDLYRGLGPQGEMSYWWWLLY